MKEILKDERLRAMVVAAVSGGREVMQVYSGEISVEKKADSSPLTEADRRSHDRIEEILRSADPDTPILSEEGAHDEFSVRRSWERYYLIDPLDGTKEFIKRNGEFTINVALMERDGEYAVPRAGVVYAPDMGLLYVGVVAERSAWLIREFNPDRPAEEQTARRLPVSASRQGRPYTIVASRSHLSPETEAFIEERRLAHPELDLISAGSSLKLCRVAEGAADEYPRFAPTMEWDTAAGDAVARAAGFAVVEWTDGDEEGPRPVPAGPGAPLRYNKEDLHNPWFLVFNP